jgi:hypothetical protein
MPNADINPVRQGTDNDDDMVAHTQQKHKERRLLAVAAGGLSEVGQQSSPYQPICIYSMMSFRHDNTPEELSSNQWQSVLRLSKIFRLDDVRQNAAKNLKDIFLLGTSSRRYCARKRIIWLTELSRWSKKLLINEEI